MPRAPLGETDGRPRGFRGENAARSGATLVELCVAMLLLAIVFAGWVRMNNIQAVNKESLRYAAVEKAAGMLDVVASLDQKAIKKLKAERYLEVSSDGTVRTVGNGSGGFPFETVLPVYENGSTIGYQCHVEQGLVVDGEDSVWGEGTKWIVVDLFDKCGDCRSSVDPFVSLKMALAQ